MLNKKWTEYIHNVTRISFCPQTTDILLRLTFMCPLLSNQTAGDSPND